MFHSFRMFLRRLTDEVGFMDSVRISADDEFFVRLRVMYGQGSRKCMDIVEKESGHRIPMYFAYRRAGSLTANTASGYSLHDTKITGHRKTYIEKYTQWYSEQKARGQSRISPLTGRSFVHLEFPLRFRPFAVPEIHRIETQFDNQLVIASMSTCSRRKDVFGKAVLSIAPYVDSLYIYLNDLPLVDVCFSLTLRL